jgi:RHS repeat-associated protein
MKILNYVITAFVALFISVSAHAQQYSKITYVHSDPDGTAFAATDEQGNVEWKIEHFPFGREFENTSQDRNSDISFAGKPYDEEIGLSYFGGRWYDPDAGRFTGIDPMPVQANDYETFNRYSYAFNNPYKYVDPDGNFAFLIPIAIFLAKEIAAEAASRATGGATDFLSVRRSGTKLIKGGISLLNKQKKNSLSTMDTSAAMRGGCRCCFSGATLVQTKAGLKPIEEIQAGELVASKSDLTGEIEWKPVTEKFVFDDDRLTYELVLENNNGGLEKYEVTDNHPFNVVGEGWVDSINLVSGMQIPNYEGELLEVVSLRSLNRSPVTYNIEVADFNTYFVGQQGAWVHNMCACATKGALRLPQSVGASVNITTRSLIKDSPFATRLAQKLSQGAQRDVDSLLSALRAGNANPGIGTRALGNGFFELRGRNAGRVIIKQTSSGAFDIIGKFQGHARGDAANSAIIQRFISGG